MVRQRDYECQPQDSGSEHSLPNYCEIDYDADFESDQEFQQDPLFIARMPNMEESKSIRSKKILPLATYKEKIREYWEQITDRQQIKFLWGAVIVLLILLCWSFMRTPSQPPNADMALVSIPVPEHPGHFEHSHDSPLVLSETPSSIFDMDDEPDLVLPTTSIEITESSSERMPGTFAEPEPIRTVSNYSVWNREPQNTGDVQTTWNNTSPPIAHAPGNADSMDDGTDFAALSQQWNTPDANANMPPSANDRNAFQSTNPPQFMANPQQNNGRYSQNINPHQNMSSQQNIPPQNNVMGQQAPAYPNNNAGGFNTYSGGHNPTPNPTYNQPVPQNAPQGSGIYNTTANSASYAGTQQPYNNIPNNTMTNAAPFQNPGNGYAQPQGIQGANASPYNMVNHREEIPANPTNNTYRNTGATPYGAIQNGPYATDTIGVYDANAQQRLATSTNTGSRFDGAYSGNTVQETPQTYQQQLNQQQYGNVPSYGNSQRYSQ